jgi:hypothetical protein
MFDLVIAVAGDLLTEHRKIKNIAQTVHQAYRNQVLSDLQYQVCHTLHLSSPMNPFR